MTLADFPPRRFWERNPKPPLTPTEPLRHEVGIHEECSNPLYFFRVGREKESHGLITCPVCSIRIVIPKTVLTYGNLRTLSVESDGTL